MSTKQWLLYRILQLEFIFKVLVVVEYSSMYWENISCWMYNILEFIVCLLLFPSMLRNIY